MSFTPSPQQAAIFDWVANGTGNAIVEAVAGSGKTTTIMQAIPVMRGEILLAAFNKKIATELQTRIDRMDVPEGCFPRASTLHSAGYGGMRHLAQRFTTDDRKVHKIFDKLAPDGDPDRPYLKFVAKICAMWKQRGFGIEGLEEATTDNLTDMIYTYDLLDSTQDVDVSRAIELARKVMEISNAQFDVIDFSDMIYLPLLHNVPLRRYDWVLIDEAQDLNPTRRELVRRLGHSKTRFVFVGDGRQAIYGFTGSDNNSMEIIRDVFNAQSFPLTVSYRCPKAVVALAQTWVSHIEAHESAPEGIVRGQDWKGFVSEVKPGDAVLCRFTAPLVAGAFGLIRQRIPARVEGRAIGQGLVALATKWKVENIDALLARVDNWAITELERLRRLERDNAVAALEDKIDTLKIMAEEAQREGIETQQGFADYILRMFEDDIRGAVVFCSAHRSKGLEWEKVFLMGRQKFMPAKFARQPWQVEQENNLIYVAVTRSQNELVEIEAPPRVKRGQ